MIDWTKPVQTRDGRSVRVLCTDRRHDDSVVALITSNFEGEDLITCDKRGHFFRDRESRNDLINVPQRHKHADVIIAWANGAEIETRLDRHEHWRSVTHPVWANEYEYRVKPD